MSDLISRQAMMKEFADFVRKSNNSDFAPTPTWNDAVSLVGSMPSAQPDVPDTNVGDMISRQAAIDAAINVLLNDEYWVEQLNKAIKALPSAQPEIIHCKDCKYFGVDRYKKLTWCSRIDYGYGYQADDFCSKAKRRTDE